MLTMFYYSSKEGKIGLSRSTTTKFSNLNTDEIVAWLSVKKGCDQFAVYFPWSREDEARVLLHNSFVLLRTKSYIAILFGLSSELKLK